MTQVNAEGLAKLAEVFPNVDVRQNVHIAEYKLMYLFGGWICSQKFYAESDDEAIYDADKAEKVAQDKLQYALWCGGRLVKRY